MREAVIKLGLPEGATEDEVRAAMKEKWAEHKGDRIEKIKEKLGLPEEATEDDVREAMRQYWEENKDHMHGFRGHKRQSYSEMPLV